MRCPCECTTDKLVVGMLRALQLQIGERYSIITLLFFVPYIIFVRVAASNYEVCR